MVINVVRLKFNTDVKVNGKALSSHNTPTSLFKQHIVNELLGTASLERFGSIQFMSSGVVKDSLSTMNYQFERPNRLRLYGSYTPSSSYTLDGMRIMTRNNNSYFVTSITPVSVISGNPVNFSWTVELGVSNRNTSGFLTKYNIDAKDDYCRLLSLILQIFLGGRTAPSPTGVSLKPSQIEVIGQDGATIIASSTNITASYDSSTSTVKWVTDTFKITQTSGSNEYIKRITFRDTVSGCGLVVWSPIQYEYVNLDEYIQIELRIGV
jgi:hypothetical protein